LKDLPTASVVSLGCAKNLVDSEVLLGILHEAGYPLVVDPDFAEIVVVNTCCFIESATQETIESIRQMESRRKDGSLSTLIVAGCLPERFRNRNLTHRFPWADAFLGPGDIPQLASIVQRCLRQERVLEVSPHPTWLYDHTSPRVRLTPDHTAYVKIAEGCSHACTFCLIPRLRGRYRSRRMASILKEVLTLAGEGTLKEVNLVAQDTTAYGTDLYGRPRLASLIERLGREHPVPWIRLLYSYPRGFSRELIDRMASTPSICKYVDLPLQHCNDHILRRMRRGVTRQTTLRLIDRLRSHIPNLTLRTTLMVGFPGETEEHFEELLEFVDQVRFERLGAFAFSAEDGVTASRCRDHVPEDVKQERLEALLGLQRSISLERNRARVGEVLEALVDGFDEDDPSMLLARTEGDAPDVDGTVIIPGGTAEPGDFVRVRVTEATEYDLVAEPVAEA